MTPADVARQLTLSQDEIQELTGYKRPAEQLAELRRQGFTRARLNRLGKVLLERSHYDAVTRGAVVAAPKVRLMKVHA